MGTKPPLNYQDKTTCRYLFISVQEVTHASSFPHAAHNRKCLSDLFLLMEMLGGLQELEHYRTSHI